MNALASKPAAGKFADIATRAASMGFQIYLIIDEYDNFTNTMLRSEASRDYRSVTHGAGFYRSWFKKFKEACSRIFMTGVSPVTMDDLTSGFNIAANLTQFPAYNAMAGFSEAEVVKMYSDFKGTGGFTDGDPAAIVKAIKPWYDGYCFSTAQIGRECVFNSDMVLYYLKALVDDGAPPKNMVDANIRTDYEKLKIIADIQRQHKHCAGTGSCAVQNSDGQDGAIATVPASPGAGAANAMAGAAASAAAPASPAASPAAAGQGTGAPASQATASASPAAGQATAQAADQAFPSEFCTPPDAADAPASVPSSSSSVLDSMGVLPITEQLATTGEISFDLVESFPADRISDLANFHSLFHYYGIVSMQGRRRGSTVFRIPNVCVRRQLFDYLRDAYHRVRAPNWIEWSHLASAFAYRGEYEPFLRRLAQDYAETTPIRGGLQGEIRVQGYMQAEFGHLKFYLLAPEMELACGTTLHQIVYVFRGFALHTLEEIVCEEMV